MKLLTTLYRLYSPTFGEKEMSRFVQDRLTKIGVEFKTNKNQIYNLKKDTPMISCHMDQVGWKPLKKLTIKNDKITGDRQIGADDKNGIWICLRLLEHFGNNISFIFSTGEEAGCEIDDVLEEHDEEILDNIKYALVFDRMGNRDVIGPSNNYCMPDLHNEILCLGAKDGWHKADGVWSDADIIAYYDIPCVNLSVGYYRAHSDWEYTKLKELAESLAFGKKILTEITDTYDRTDYFTKNGNGATGWAPINYGVTYGAYTEDEEFQDEYREEWPFYCSSCDMTLDFDEVEDDDTCILCGCVCDDIQEYDWDDLPDEAEWMELWYCPVCCGYVPSDSGVCPDCGGNAMKECKYTSDTTAGY